MERLRTFLINQVEVHICNIWMKSTYCLWIDQKAVDFGFAYIRDQDFITQKIQFVYCILAIINPFPNKPWFLNVCSTSLVKTLWEKEKLLVMSNFSFSHSVFYPFGKLSAIFIKFKIVVC